MRRKDKKFDWSNECNEAFIKLKNSLAKATLLVHFDPKIQLVLATDASDFGIGAVLMHRYPDGTEKPIAHASKTLNQAERNYSQIEKEGLSIVYGVKKFHQFLAARKFLLFTDHQPLVTIFHPAKGIPVYTLKRLQRWALTLMPYTFDIQYKPTKKHANADALSRLPSGPDPTFTDEDSLKLNRVISNQINRFPMTYKKVAEETQACPILKKVVSLIQSNWPINSQKLDTDLKPYYTDDPNFQFKAEYFFETPRL